jgi:hypothetical protein
MGPALSPWPLSTGDQLSVTGGAIATIILPEIVPFISKYGALKTKSLRFTVSVSIDNTTRIKTAIEVFCFLSIDFHRAKKDIVGSKNDEFR